MKILLLLVMVHVELSWGLTFTHHMELHEDYKMWWMFDETYITVKVKAKTTGERFFLAKRSLYRISYIALE